MLNFKKTNQRLTANYIRIINKRLYSPYEHHKYEILSQNTWTQLTLLTFVTYRIAFFVNFPTDNRSKEH